MKKGIVSIVMSCIAMYVMYLKHRHILIGISQQSNFTKDDLAYLSETHLLDEIIYFVPTMILGLLGVSLGIISLKQKNKIGIVGIIVSIAAMILYFVPIWEYMLNMYV